MNQLAQDLRAAKALIDTPEKWTQGAYARAGFNSLPVDDPRANCFCAKGAIRRATDYLEWMRADDAAAEKHSRWVSVEHFLDSCLEEQGHTKGIVEFNDTHTHAEVMAAWDKAIELAEASS